MAKKSKKSKKQQTRKSKKALRKGSTSTDKLFADGVPSRFSNLPEGTYDGYIKPGSFIIEPKEDGSGHRALCSLIVTSPEEFEGRTQVKRSDLSTQIGVNIFLGELETLEFDQPASLEEASELLAETDNIPVRFWVGPQNDEYPPKVRFNERLEGEGGREDEAEDESEDETEDESEEEESEYTKKDIKKMDEEALTQLIEDEALDIDPDDYDTWPEVATACIEELGL